MPSAVVKELKKINQEQGHKEFFRHIIYCHFSWRLVNLLIYTNITPNTVTMMSTLLALVAAAFYFQGSYSYLIIGTVFLNISYILDCADGELARYKKMNSNFGAWFDGVLDMVVEYLVIAGISLGIYFNTKDVSALILGFFAIGNHLMILNIRSLNRRYFDVNKQGKINMNHEFTIKGRFFGGAELFTVLVTLTTLLNKPYYLLLIYSILGALVWMRQIYRRVKTYNS